MHHWLVNESTPHYNLGLQKAANWLRRMGHSVTLAPFGMETQLADMVWFSAIFSWHIPQLLQHVALVRAWGKEIEIGGPAVTVNAERISLDAGVLPTIGLDSRFDREPGEYLATFTSRGCIRNCPWCVVPRAEGGIREIPDFIPATMVHDNNFPATSEAHQVRAIERLRSAVKRVDFDQAWDARLFDQWHLSLYRKANPTCWRFAFDFMGIEPEIVRVCGLLKRAGLLNRSKVTIFALVGFGEGWEKDVYRAQRIAELGASPFVMKYVPLNADTKDSPARGWPDSAQLTQLARYYNIPQVWTSHADLELWLKRIKPKREAVATMPMLDRRET